MLKKLLTLFPLVILLWLAGLLLFYYHTSKIKPDSAAQSSEELIVVLTGDQKRIEEGLSLLAQKRKSLMLISGVHSKTTKSQILKGVYKNYRKQIYLGKLATDTISNAIEVMVFARLNKIRSMRIITSNYHVPRAKLVFEETLPQGYQVEWYPVMHKSNDKLIKEYNKYLATLISVYQKRFSKAIHRFIEGVAFSLTR